MPAKHICGACGQEFNTEAAYTGHTCPTTDHKPTAVAHQDALTGGAYSSQSQAARERGAAREEE